MRQRIVGTFPIGHEYCELVLREDTGGEFYFMPEKAHIARIKIGADYEHWDDVLNVILHEALELILARTNTRYIENEDMGRDISGFLFVMTHHTYSDVCARLAKFLVPALPAAEKAWRIWKKPIKAKKTKLARRCGKQ